MNLKRQEVDVSSAPVLEGISEPARTVLKEALMDKTVQGPDGERRKVVANISLDHSAALHNCVRQRKPRLVIEIGMAYGVSTLAILTALDANKEGRLISIDPYIGWPTGLSVAIHQIERAGLSHLHEHIHETSQLALPALLKADSKPDFIYIDGYHNFEYVLTDFFFTDRLLSRGGVVAFNDAGWRAVFKVIRFLKRYRRYRELDVGLTRSYRSRNPIFSMIKRIQGRSSADRYFEKREDWEPKSGFYQDF